MLPNIICRTAQVVLSMSAAFLVVDSILPGHGVSGMSHVVGYCAGSCLGLLAVGVEHLRTQWAARQRHRAGYRQRHTA